MKEFALIFRSSSNGHATPTPEQLQERVNWVAGIAAQNKLVDKGKGLSANLAKTVRPDDVVTDGPFTEIKEFINGFIIIRAETIDEAVEFAKSNPILKAGGNVEVRAILTPGKKDQ